MTRQTRPTHDQPVGHPDTPGGSRRRGPSQERGALIVWGVLLAFTLSVLALATVPDPSDAANPRVSTVVLNDGPDDVWIGTIDTPNPTETSLPAADVLRSRISHRRYAVRVRLRFGDLQRVGVQSFNFGISTPTNDYKGGVVSKPGHRRGTQDFAALGGPNHCSGFTHQISYRTDVVFMRVPRSCLGRPRWVKVTLWNFLTTGPEPTDSFMDNPHDHQGFPQNGTRRLYRHTP